MEPSIYAALLVIGFMLGRFTIRKGSRPADYDIIVSTHLEDRTEERLLLETFDNQNTRIS
jgi:hypothetical protein